MLTIHFSSSDRWLGHSNWLSSRPSPLQLLVALLEEQFSQTGSLFACVMWRTNVVDDLRRRARELFQSTLEDRFYFRLFHGLPQFPMRATAAEPFEHSAEKKERQADIDVGDIDMLVRPMRFFD